MSAEDDAALLARVVEEEGLARADEGVSIGVWLYDLLVALAHRLEDLARGSLEGWAGDTWVGVAAVVLATAAVLGLLARAKSRRRRPDPRPRASPTVLPPGPEARRRRMDALLAAGDARAALAELWPWLATGLADRGYGRWQPDRTVREFVATVPADWDGHAPLRSVAGDVERLSWGAARPTVGEVRATLTAAEVLLR